MQCLILGPLRVIGDDGDDRTPRSDQQRRVLAMLAARAPDAVSVEVLEELLWPDGAPSANALQSVVSKLRKVVAPVAIEVDPAGYSLHGASTDVEEFDRLVADDRFAEAEGLVRGRPLDDLGDDPMVVGLRARWDAQVQSSRARRLETAVEATPAHALAELRELVAVEPLVESWWRLLMLAEYRIGRGADALRTYQRARTTMIDELGVDPSPELIELERRILEHDVEVVSTAHATRPLPAPLGSFVGREGDLAALESAIGSHRLVTLVGPGGVGKTTTSLELARHSAPDEARWVALAPLADRDGIVRALARAVGLPESDQGIPGTMTPYHDPLERVVDALASQRALLVVDNCEHVIDEIAAIVHRVLVDCQGVRVVATSRELLGVPGEHVFALPPLPPDDALALLGARARDSGVGIDAADTDLLRAVCERLDGLPLAIELAAARLRTVTAAELFEGLSDRFAMLSRGPRTVDDRQRSLRAVVDWSHDLLEPIDRMVFRRLAAFVGGCDAAAATVVCAGGSVGGGLATGTDVETALERLVDKSLVIAAPGPSGMRFRLLETLRAYAREQLHEAGELDTTLVRHAQYFADTLQPAMRGLVGPDQRHWLARLSLERRNIDVAFDTAVANDDTQLALEIAAPLGWYFFMMGELEPGGDMLNGALSCAGPAEPELRALALAFSGWLAANGPNVERAVAITAEAMSLLDHVADPWSRSVIADMHAMSQFFAGRLDVVEQMLPEIKRLAEESDDLWAQGIAKVVVGEVVQFRGNSLVAEQEFVAAAEMFDSVGDQFSYALAITEASEIAEQFGHYDRAVEMLERGIEIADEVGFSSHPSAMRARLGNIEVLRGNLDAAERHHRMLIDDPVAAGVPWLQAMARFGLSLIARRRGDLELAGEHLDVAWALPRSQSVPYLRSLVLVGRGFLADQRGDATEALAHQLAALEATEQLMTPRGTAFAFEGCAAALALFEDDDVAALATGLLGHADRLRRESGGPMPEAERFDIDRAEQRLRGRLGGRYDDAWASGATIETPVLADRVRAYASLT